MLVSRRRAGAVIAGAFIAGAGAALLGGLAGVAAAALLGLLAAAIFVRRSRERPRAVVAVAPSETVSDSPLPPRAYAIKPIVSAGVRVVKTIPAMAYARPAPMLINAPPGIEAAVAHHGGRPTASRAAAVCELENAVVLDDGLLLTVDRTIVGESLINRPATGAIYVFQRTGPAEATGPGRLPPLRAVPFSRCVLLAQHWDGNYGHWLVDTLPRIALLEGLYDKARLRILLRDRIGPIRAVQRECLLALGFEDDQFVWFKGDIVVDHLIYPAPITLPPWIKSPLCIDVLERVAAALGPADGEGPRKVYVSRNRDAGDRKLLNEAAVVDLLAQRGYVALDPGLMDFRSQVHAFAGATHVIGNAGAGLTNIAFAPRGVRLLALTTEHMTDDFFYDLVALKQGAYWSLHGAAAGAKPGFRDDFTIDLDLLDRALAGFDASPAPMS